MRKFLAIIILMCAAPAMLAADHRKKENKLTVRREYKPKKTAELQEIIKGYAEGKVIFAWKNLL